MKQSSLFIDANTDQVPSQLAAVLVPYPVDKAYDYAVPAGLDFLPGDYVCVPLGKREIPGVVWGEGVGGVLPSKLKTAVAKYDLPPMSEGQRKFIDWMAHYTMNAKGAVLKMCLSVPKALEKPKPAVGYASPSPHRGEGRVGGQEYKAKPPEILIQRAQEMRREPAETERKFWERLRKNQQQGFRFRRQHPVSPYIVDFICLEKRVVVELDGVLHEDRKEYDAERTRYLKEQGYEVLRFKNEEVIANIERVLETVAQVVESRASWVDRPPTLALPPKGGGEVPPKFQKVLDVLSDGIARRPSELAELSGVSTASLKTLAKKGIIKQVEMKSAAPCRAPDIHKEGPPLSPDQEAAAERLKDFVQKGGYQPVLLDGVTGAGKTEVYFEAIAETLKQGQQVLILLPEIALSNSFLGRFKNRFGCNPALWHSVLGIAQRKSTWRGVAEGECKVIAGARSALFLPYKNLGLIVVDEEHDPAYKQEEGVIYHARDMAVARAHIEKIPIILVSATPSLETIHNAWNGRYAHLHLPDRFGGARLPEIKIIDMREDKPERQHFISPTLKNAMIETLKSGEQVLLFLNRRGYAPLTICRSCGHRMECPRCSAWLVEHKASSKLHCHHCAFDMKIPKECPACNAKESFAVCGPGVERIHEEVKAAFPDARMLVLASDTADSNEKLRQMLEDIKDKKIDIIIGTQIIAKGHHFPSLTLVGVIDADLGLNGGELRGAERTYQLLHQVAGRAGREEKKGAAYLQTFMPEHKIMKALANEQRDKFLEVEAFEREKAHMPPYARLAGIIVSGRDEAEVKYIARELGKAAPQSENFQVLGPAPAPFARLRGKYRYRLLVRTGKNIDIQKSIDGWLGGIKIPSSVKVAVDIDPQSFF